MLLGFQVISSFQKVINISSFISLFNREHNKTCDKKLQVELAIIFCKAKCFDLRFYAGSFACPLPGFFIPLHHWYNFFFFYFPMPGFISRQECITRNLGTYRYIICTEECKKSYSKYCCISRMISLSLSTFWYIFPVLFLHKELPRSLF